MSPRKVGLGISALLHGGLFLAVVTVSAERDVAVTTSLADGRVKLSGRFLAAPQRQAVEPAAEPVAAQHPVAQGDRPVAPSPPPQQRPRSTRPKADVANAMNDKLSTPMLQNGARPASPAPHKPVKAQPPPPLPRVDASEAEASPASEGQQPRSLPPAGSSDATTAITTARALAANPGPDTDALRERYLSALFDAIERNKRYPRSARRLGLEGCSRIAFTLHPSGQIAGVRIIGESGEPVLDRAALAAVAAVGDTDPFPPQLGWKGPLQLTLRIEFVMP